MCCTPETEECERQLIKRCTHLCCLFIPNALTSGFTALGKQALSGFRPGSPSARGAALRPLCPRSPRGTSLRVALLLPYRLTLTSKLAVRQPRENTLSSLSGLTSSTAASARRPLCPLRPDGTDVRVALPLLVARSRAEETSQSTRCHAGSLSPLTATSTSRRARCPFCPGCPSRALAHVALLHLLSRTKPLTSLSTALHALTDSPLCSAATRSRALSPLRPLSVHWAHVLPTRLRDLQLFQTVVVNSIPGVNTLPGLLPGASPAGGCARGPLRPRCESRTFRFRASLRCLVLAHTSENSLFG